MPAARVRIPYGVPAPGLDLRSRAGRARGVHRHGLAAPPGGYLGRMLRWLARLLLEFDDALDWGDELDLEPLSTG